jgi:hypothetical protein
MKLVRVYIKDTAGDFIEVEPINNAVFEFTRKSVRYEHKIKTKIVLTRKEDFVLVMSYGWQICSNIDILIQENCDGNWGDYWRGVFKFTDLTIDEENCTISFIPRSNTLYDCIGRNIANDYDLRSGQVPHKIINLRNGITYENLGNCTVTIPGVPTVRPPSHNQFCLVGNPTHWFSRWTSLAYNSATSEWEGVVTWERVLTFGGCFPPAGVIQITGNCTTGGQWASPPINGIWNIANSNRGVTIQDVLVGMINSLGCNLTTTSIFLNINPSGVAPVNSAYAYATAYCKNILVFQKSDIKRPNSSNAATTSWIHKAESFINDLLLMFNLAYVIEGSMLRIEHVSYFNRVVGLSIPYYNIRNKYEFEKGENIKKETYKFMDDGNSGAPFDTSAIIYDCGENNTEYRLSCISTDLLYLQDPANSDSVSDEGFVLISAGIPTGITYNPLYYVVGGIFGSATTNVPNAQFSWKYLHHNLFSWGRKFASGIFEGDNPSLIPTRVFQSDKLRKAEQITHPICCAVFNPVDLVETKLGEGVVESAEHDLWKKTIKLDLRYEI